MIIETKNCIYCGGEGELERERVIPSSFFGFRSFNDERQWIVTACRTCNGLAGNKVFFSIPEKLSIFLVDIKLNIEKLSLSLFGLKLNLKN